jgi:Phosphate-selective porin O and P
LRTTSRLSPGLGLLTLCLVSLPLAAQTTYPTVKVTGRLQEQFYYYDNGDYAAAVGPTSNFFTRRARIEARAALNEYVSVFIQPSFEGGRASGVRLRDAFIDVRLTKPEAKNSFTIRMGQEKRPFGRYELTSSNNLPSIERGAGQGLVALASNDIFTKAGYLSHDVGAHAQLDFKLSDLRKVTLIAGAYNGQGESVRDANDSKSFGVRGTVGLTDKLDVGGSFFSHDAIVNTSATTIDSSFTNSGWGVDASWGKPGDPGLYLVGDFMSGKDGTAAEATMQGISVVGAFNIRMKSPTSWLYAIEPMARFDRADPDTDTDDNATTLITVGLGFYMTSRAQFRVAYENESFQASGASSISGVRSALTVNF